jgi:predicted RNase H-like nuclease
MENCLSSRRQIDRIDLKLPKAERSSFFALKPYEDQIDVLVCPWVGALYIEGKASALGDDHSAIWVPTQALKLKTFHHL